MFGVRADTMGFQKAKSLVWLLGLIGVLWVVGGWIAAGASKQVILDALARGQDLSARLRDSYCPHVIADADST